jgi:hypothetical protein
VPEDVSEVRSLRIELVSPTDEKAMRTWNELILGEHPQGKRRLVGPQLRYLVGSAHGWLGAVGFGASALCLEARDAWIGWEPQQRRRHLGYVVNLARLLIRPSVRCRNLATHVLGGCLRVLKKDFDARYGYSPWLVETFVDRERHSGSCFQGGNWERIGETKGRGRNDRDGRRGESIKDVYVFPLVPDFRERMGVPADRGNYLRPQGLEEGLDSETWVEREFGTVELGDERLRDRLVKIVQDKSRHPGSSYLDSCGGDRYATKAYYYFIDSDREDINPDTITATHRKRTIERMMSHDLVLVVQDTSDLNFSTRRHTTGLGLIGTNQTGAESLGLKLHSSIALTTDGLPLGVLRSVSFAAEKRGRAGKKSIGRPIEEKKTFRWIQGYRDCVSTARKMPKTHILSVADREGDIFELFAEAEPTRNRVGLLVRARHDRALDGREQKLFERLKTSSSLARIEVALPRQRTRKAKSGKPEQKGLPARKAVLSIRYEEVRVSATRSDLSSAEPIRLFAVYAHEEKPPDGAKPIEWLLLTTEPVRTADDAARMIDLYTKRWRIEEWHRILKSGCKVLDHQHQTAERLKRAIALDTVLAWRIQLMTLLGRQSADLPAGVFFDQWEVLVLDAIRAQRTKSKKKSPPMTLGEAIIEVAKLGGYLARASDSAPGAECLWKGIIELYAMSVGFRLAKSRDGP